MQQRPCLNARTLTCACCCKTDNLRATSFAEHVEVMLNEAFGPPPYTTNQVARLADAIRDTMGSQLKPRPFLGIGLCPVRCAWWPWQENYISNLGALEKPQFVKNVVAHIGAEGEASAAREGELSTALVQALPLTAMTGTSQIPASSSTSQEHVNS
jgi:hypothetical protein